MATVHALVPAGGRGERFGGERTKLLWVVGGKPVLAWTLERLAGRTASVTVAVPAELLAEVADAVPAGERVHWVSGGETRQESVAACLTGCPAAARDWVLVHDGARPALHAEDLAAAVAAAGEADGAVLGRPVSDTLKLVAGGHIQGTVDRSFLFRAETPQVFSRELLERALAAAAESRFVGTDEASLVERLPGVRIAAVAARHPNPKLTTPADLPWIEALLGGR
ncbi:MAG: 2-C-methyl-D-erythritol 4-phosphate cytidylyltransferase [Thermoanaerobaculia bacterium]